MPQRSNNTVVVAGSLAQRARRGGHSWVYLQYLLGFRSLGWDVLFLDRFGPGMDISQRYLEDVLEPFGLGGDYALVDDQTGSCLGRSRAEVLKKVQASTLLLNINGFLTDEEILRRAPLRVFVDIDPGFGQMWRELGLHDLFAGHDAYVSVAENIGQPDCAIPTCGFDWITMPQPIALDHWPDDQPHGERFSSVGSWRGPFGPIEYRGETFGLRVHEFRKFAGLPSVSSQRFEMALEIDRTEEKDLELLRDNGWLLADPAAVAGDPWSYRDYIQHSKAEFMVARNMYVQTGSGWFSDRSICYLASGRPVLAQDTGFTRHYPCDHGLLAFSTLDGAAAGAEEISRDYGRHARAARSLAEEYFDARKVLPRLLDNLGVSS